MFVAELATGGGDVASTTCADVGIDASVLKDSLEGKDSAVLRARIGHAFDFVVANEIDVATKCACEIGEFSSVFGLIVKLTQKDVFEGDFAACFIEVEVGGFGELFDGDVLGPWNELLTDLVVWRVK